MTAAIENENDFEDVSCPLGCDADARPIVRGRDRLNGLPGEFQVVECGRCGLMRTSPRPTPAAMWRYYPDDYSPYRTTRVAAAGEARLTHSRSARFSLAPQNHPLPRLKPGRLLEIGCGSGSFLHEMAAIGWDVAGVEFSATAAAAARELGYNVQTGPLETATAPASRMDLVVGWMVLEHLHDPVGALRRIREWTTDDAWLVLSVPDGSAWERRAFGDAWYALSLPTHLFHYTPRTLSMVLAAAGWRADKFIWQRNPNNLLHSIRYRCEDRGWQSAASYLADVAECRRAGRLRAVLGVALAALRQSGRMTVWARPHEVAGGRT